MSSHNNVEVGDTIDLVCKAKEVQTIQPDFAILVNGEEVEAVSTNIGIEAKVSVVEEHFITTRRSIGLRPQSSVTPDTLLVECLAKFGQHVAANTSMSIKRGAKQPGHQDLPRNAKAIWNDPVQHRDHAKAVPCHSYVVVENMFNQGTVIRGEVIEEVLEDIESPTKTAEDR